MIPTDADISREVDVEVNALPIENVIAQMESRKVDSSSKPNFVILDACRNNPFEKRYKSSQDGLARMATPANTLIAFAAAPGRVSEAGFSGTLSLYTEVLVEQIDQPDVDVTFMFREVQRAVYAHTKGRQAPDLNLPPNLPNFFSFKPVARATMLLEQMNSDIEGLMKSPRLGANDMASLNQLRINLSSLNVLLTSAPLPEGGLPADGGLPVGLAAGDVDSMVGPEVDSLQVLTTEIERLMALPSLSADDTARLQQLMLKRVELSMAISQIFSSAHESRKLFIQSIKN